MGQEIGFDLTEFDKLIAQIGLIEADVEEIVDTALTNATNAGMREFKRHVPLGNKPNKQGHARDNVIIGDTVITKKGAIYRQITFTGDRSYLYMIDYGTSTIDPKPWRKKAYRAVKKATQPIIKATIINELNRRLGR